MRIVSGIYRGKKIKYPLGEQTRPTKDRIREAIFNMLEHANWRETEIEGSFVMDAFAGSGSLGFESISRGAENCVFIDNHIEAYQCCTENMKDMDISSNCLILKENILSIRQRPDNIKRRNLVFLDPPYSMGLGEKALDQLIAKDWLENEALIILEMAKNAPENISEDFTLLDERDYAITKVYFLKYIKGNN